MNRRPSSSYSSSSRLTRWIRRAGVVLLVGPLVFLFLFAVYVFTLRKDIPSVADWDLYPDPPPVAESENALAALHDAESQLKVSDEEAERARSVLTDGDWDARFAEGLIARNQRALRAMDVMVTKRALWLTGSEFDGPYVADDHMHLITLRDLGSLKGMQAALALERGDQVAATSAAFELLDFGQLVQGSAGGIPHYFMGTHAKDRGLEQLRRMIARFKEKNGQVRVLGERVAAYRVNARALSDSLRRDYLGTTAAFDKDFGPRSAPTMSEYQFQRNRTTLLYANAYRAVIAGVERPALPEVRIKRFRTGSDVAKVYNFLLVPNGMGRASYEIVIPSIIDTLYRKARENDSVTATQMLFFIGDYKSKKGALPRSLDELVPAYFPQVPKSDFDGGPFQYSADKKTLGFTYRTRGDKPPNEETFTIPF